MADRVRLLHYEAEDVHCAVEDYLDKIDGEDEVDHTYGNAVAAEDLVNRIAEIYETALARTHTHTHAHVAAKGAAR